MIKLNLVSSINEKNILVNIDAKDKEDALKQLIHTFYETGNIQDESLFLTDVYAREAEGATGIGNGVAIPHGKGPTVKEPAVGIATLNYPIPWESLDDKKTQIVVLFAVTDSIEGAKEHLKVLSQFARKLGNDSALKNLKEAHTIQDIVNVFEN